MLRDLSQPLGRRPIRWTRKEERPDLVEAEPRSLQNFGIGRRQTADGLRLTFRDHPAVAAELQALVAVENDCCSWTAWTVERDEDGTLVMAARSQGEGITTLHGMFTKEATPWKTASECC